MTKIEWVEVLWLRHHVRYAYSKGQIGTVQKKDLPELLGSEDVEPYVKVLKSEEKQAILESRKPAPPSEEPLINVKWLKFHPNYAYSKGNLGRIFLSAASELLKGEYIQPITDEEVQQILDSKKPQISQEADFEKVTWLKPHPDFAYNAMDVGLVAKTKLESLLKDNYVERYHEKTKNSSVWDKFKVNFKK